MQDFLFFVGLILVVFAIWVGSGGPDRPISFSGPFLAPITNTGTNADSYGDPNLFSPIGGGTSNSSPYRGSVSLSRDTSGAMSTDPKSEYVVIRYSSSAHEPITVSGWKLVSTATNKEVTLPDAAQLPNLGRVSDTDPVFLHPGHEVIVTTGRSPVGVSFNENRCTGYFEERQNFTPSLAFACPSGGEEFSRYYDDEDDACEMFARGINRCETETDVPSELSSSCEAFVDEYMNYSGCVEAHEQEVDFYSGTWRLFLGKSDELWKKSNETILLVDSTGKTVDALSY